MKKARSGLREILEERLKALNNQWDKLQDHASARQKDLEQLVQDKADNEVLSGEDSSLNALRNNTALLSSLYFNIENEVRGNITVQRGMNKVMSKRIDAMSRNGVLEVLVSLLVSGILFLKPLHCSSHTRQFLETIAEWAGKILTEGQILHL